MELVEVRPKCQNVHLTLAGCLFYSGEVLHLA